MAVGASRVRDQINEMRTYVSRWHGLILCANPMCSKPLPPSGAGPKGVFCSTACRQEHRLYREQLLILHAKAARLEPSAIELRAGANRLRSVMAEIDRLLRIYGA